MFTPWPVTGSWKRIELKSTPNWLSGILDCLNSLAILAWISFTPPPFCCVPNWDPNTPGVVLLLPPKKSVTCLPGPPLCWFQTCWWSWSPPGPSWWWSWWPVCPVKGITAPPAPGCEWSWVWSRPEPVRCVSVWLSNKMEKNIYIYEELTLILFKFEGC